ncbi:MAG: hypothetical protein JKY65_11985 [Planctomycetes bacterium]|nr:hypothetical protein [Planctomycetota bacterium]
MRCLSLVLFLLLPLLLSGCMDSRALSGPEIRNLLGGAKVEGRHEIRGYSFVREYDETTFTQIRPDGAQATWRVTGNQVCIQWNGKGRNLCRSIRTNDRGDYWKVRGGTKTVVTYTRIVDKATGVDRAVSGSPPVILMRLVFSPMGWFVLIASTIAYLVWKGSRPIPIVAGGQSYLPEELGVLPVKQVDAFMATALAEDGFETAYRVFEVMLAQSGTFTRSWERMWSVVGLLADEDAVRALAQILQASILFPKSLLETVSGDDRTVYLIGKGYGARAELLRRTHDATGFTTARESSMLFLDTLRPIPGAPVPEPTEATAEPAPTDQKLVGDAVDEISLVSPGIGKGQPEAASGRYQALANSAYETIMYLKHEPPPVVRSSSSSYSGGGG